MTFGAEPLALLSPMPLLQLQDIVLQYGTRPLLDHANLQVDAGERVCLLGRNGTGKTSLMRIITGEEAPNSGELVCPSGTVLTRLDQEVPDNLTGSVYDVIFGGLRKDSHEEDWEIDVRIDELMEQMKLPVREELFTSLSGGMKRRVLLARALVGQPDVLLLDEPTNHLDIDSILWLESFLLEQKMTLFFVTHDRSFLRKMATRILELDRGNLTSWACDYDTYLLRKAASLEAEEKQWAAFDKKLALEEAWLRQGVKARRTRNEGRVRALKALRDERSERRDRIGTAKIGVSETQSSGQKVVEISKACFAFGDKPIVQDFSTIIWRGDKIGIIGPNGTGKTTLLKLMLGKLEPQSGWVKLGTKIEVVYLDQLRDQIDNAKTVAQNVAGNSETVTFQGRSKHIHGYLQDFLFSPERSRMPAKMLSGGERNRLLLARLFLQPANVLVLDEPTNDLDSETMELLEDLLVEFGGTVLLVSHDRAFLDNVVTSTMVFDGEGRISEYVGGYEDWLRQKSRATLAPPAPASVAKSVEVLVADVEPKKKSTKPKTFLNRDRRELEELPSLIEKMEAEQVTLAAKLYDPELYLKQPEILNQLKTDQVLLDEKIKLNYVRWEELEAVRKACEEVV